MARIDTDKQLTLRQKEILKFIIQEHINTNAPIGSRNISRFAKYSPATIRNEMADLEYMGYLTQPHTSAGRLPSAEGYRYYLSELLTIDNPTEAIANAEKKIIDDIASSPVDKLLQQASKALYDITKNVAIVTSPAPANLIIRDIRLVQANAGLSILILVTNSGGVYNANLDTSYLRECDIDFEYLNSILLYYLKNTSIRDLGSNIDKVVTQARTLYDNTIQIDTLLSSIMESILSYSPSISVAGEKSLLSSAVSDNQRGEELYDILHDSTSCWDFVQQLSSKKDRIEIENASIIIGDNDTFLNKYAIIQVNYGNLQVGRGNVVLIGMQHMSYMKNIVALNRLKDSLTNAIQTK